MRTLLSNIFQILFQFHFLLFIIDAAGLFKLSVCVRFKELNKRYTLLTSYICVVSFIEEKPQNIYTLSKDYKKMCIGFFFGLI